MFSFAQSEPCRGGSYELVKPFLGTWGEYRVTDSTEVFTGTLTSKLDLNGCALLQRYVEQDSSFMYQTLGYVTLLRDYGRNDTYSFDAQAVPNLQFPHALCA